MDIWVKNKNELINLSNAIMICVYESAIQIAIGDHASCLQSYSTEQRAEEVLKEIQDHINAIGTNNFNNLPMVYVMPIE